MTLAIAQVLIDGTDFIAARAVQEKTISWEADTVGQNGAEIGVCRFTTRTGATLPFVPRKHQYVELIDGDGILRYAGRVKTCERDRLMGVNTGQWLIDCQDWVAELERIYVNADFTAAAGDNDKNLVTKLVALYWAQLATTGVTHTIFASHHDLPAVAITQGSMTLKQALDFLANLAGAVYYVDPLKQLHWNDIANLAAYVLDDVQKTGSYRSYYSMKQREDATSVAFRVTVVGSGGAQATVIDTVGYADYVRSTRYERGAPAARIPTLPDVTDSDLTTNAECTREGWRLLDAQAFAATIEVGLRDRFVYPGQMVYLIDQQGLPTDRHAWLDDEDLSAPGDPSRLGVALGLYLVRSVKPQALGAGKYDYAATLGAYRPTIERLQKTATTTP